MNQITREISPAELVSKASIALEDMDDLARMGDVIPTGPYAVIKRLIEAYALTISKQPGTQQVFTTKEVSIGQSAYRWLWTDSYHHERVSQREPPKHIRSVALYLGNVHRQDLPKVSETVASVSIMGTAKTIDEAILALMRPSPMGVSRVSSSEQFTYSMEGKEVHFDDELRAAIEKILDCKLQEIALADFLLEVALEIPIEKSEVASNLLQAKMAI